MTSALLWLAKSLLMVIIFPFLTPTHWNVWNKSSCNRDKPDQPKPTSSLFLSFLKPKLCFLVTSVLSFFLKKFELFCLYWNQQEQWPGKVDTMIQTENSEHVNKGHARKQTSNKQGHHHSKKGSKTAHGAVANSKPHRRDIGTPLRCFEGHISCLNNDLYFTFSEPGAQKKDWFAHVGDCVPVSEVACNGVGVTRAFTMLYGWGHRREICSWRWLFFFWSWTRFM